MIIQCKSCSRKFAVKDNDIPAEGRMVQCGYCSVTWHQIPFSIPTENIKKQNFSERASEKNEELSVEKIKASDGKTYKFLGTQWAQLLPSGKTGLFAKKKIGRELDKLTGRKKEKTAQKKQKKAKKELDPSSEKLGNQSQLPDIYQPKNGLGFFGYIFLIIIVTFSIVGVLKTFEYDLINYFPEAEYLYTKLEEQLKYVSEAVKNIIAIVKDLTISY